MTSPDALVGAGNPPEGGAPYVEVAENGLSAPLDFSTTSPSSSSEDQMVNLSERLLPAGSSPPSSYPVDANRKYPVKGDYSSKVRLQIRPQRRCSASIFWVFHRLFVRSGLSSRRRTAQEATTL